MTVIEIDLNVRTRTGTFSGFEEVCRGVLPGVGDEVWVFESESSVAGPAVVERIDHDKQLIYLAVDWSRLHSAPVMD